LTLLSPQARLVQQTERMKTLHTRLQRAGTVLTERPRNRFSALAGKLNSLSPVGVLARGYALAWKYPEQQLIHDAITITDQG
jgi:exodeoxyribonuclease VII large subunit